MDGCEERTAIPILRQQQELTVDFLAGLDEDQGEESSATDLGEVMLCDNPKCDRRGIGGAGM